LRLASDALLSVSSVDRLAEALTSYFGREVRVTTELGAVVLTANAIAQAERATRQREAEETMRSDPFVQTMMREFGASIVPGSIKPV
jgi:DNA polymerase-3 subunit gamma/tau